MVLLEFAPHHVHASGPTTSPTNDQAWPQDVIRYASGVGYEITLSDTGLPPADESILRDYKGVTAGYVTLGLVHPSRALEGTATWEAFRNRILRSLFPDDWPAPASCRGVLHAAGHEFGVLTTDDECLREDWLVGAIRTTTAVSGASQIPIRQVAKWILEEADGNGVRIESISIHQAAEARITGKWGRGDDYPSSLGKPGGSPLDVTLRLDG